MDVFFINVCSYIYCLHPNIFKSSEIFINKNESTVSNPGFNSQLLLNKWLNESCSYRVRSTTLLSLINLWINIWFLPQLISWSDKVICLPGLWRGHGSEDRVQTQVTLLQSPQTEEGSCSQLNRDKIRKERGGGGEGSLSVPTKRVQLQGRKSLSENKRVAGRGRPD